MTSTTAKPCPECGYALSPLDDACPRCAIMRAMNEPEPPAAAAPTPAVPPPPATVHPQGTMAADVIARQGSAPARSSDSQRPSSRPAASHSGHPPTAVIILSVLIGLGALAMNTQTIKQPIMIGYLIVHLLAAGGIIYGLVTLAPWARVGAIIFVIANFVIGIPVEAVAIIQASKTIEQEMIAEMNEQPGVTVTETDHDVTVTSQPSPTTTTSPAATPPTTSTPMPGVTTAPETPVTTTPDGGSGRMTIRTTKGPGDLGLLGLFAAGAALLFLGIEAVVRLILDIIFIVLLCGHETKEAFEG